MAIHLKKIGVDKIKVSLDSIDENVYDRTRKKDLTKNTLSIGESIIVKEYEKNDIRKKQSAFC